MIKAAISQTPQTTAQFQISVFTQIFEKKLVYRQLLNYIEKYEFLYQFQFGFRKGTSTEQAIAEITDNLKNTIDNNFFNCGVFLDFAKAFVNDDDYGNKNNKLNLSIKELLI